LFAAVEALFVARLMPSSICSCENLAYTLSVVDGDAWSSNLLTTSSDAPFWIARDANECRSECGDNLSPFSSFPNVCLIN
jgi:hypothetical protein